MSKALAFFIGFIFVMLPVASAGIIYDEETRQVSEIAGKWLNTWDAKPDSNWTADPVLIDDQSLYFGDTNVGTNYAKQMTMSDDGAFGAINYAQTGPHSEINTYALTGVNKMGQAYGSESLAMSDDGNYMIVADEGRSDGLNPHIYFFGAEEGPIWTYETDHSTSDVEDVDISNDGEYAVACSSGSDGDNYLLFERENNTRIYNGSFPTGDGCGITSISGDGTMAVWVQGYNALTHEVIVYDIVNREVAWTHTLPIRPWDVDISGDGERIAFGLDGGAFDEVQVFDASDGTALWSVDIGDDVRLLVWNHDHTRLAINDKAGYRWLFDGSGTQIWKTVAGEAGRAFSMSNDGSVIVSLNSEPDSLQVYNDISATPIMHNLLDEMPGGSSMEVDVSGDGKHIMAYDGEETIYIFTDRAGDGWSEEDNEPIWSKLPGGYDIEVAISSGGTFAWSDEDSNPATLNYGKIPLYSNSYNHDDPIYDEMWVADDYVADYTAVTGSTPDILYTFDEETDLDGDGEHCESIGSYECEYINHGSGDYTTKSDPWPLPYVGIERTSGPNGFGLAYNPDSNIPCVHASCPSTPKLLIRGETVADTFRTTPMSQSDSFTFSHWVNIDSNGDHDGEVGGQSFRNYGWNGSGLLFDINDDGANWAYIIHYAKTTDGGLTSSGTGSLKCRDSVSGLWALDEWHHWTFVISNTRLAIYVDAELCTEYVPTAPEEIYLYGGSGQEYNGVGFQGSGMTGHDWTHPVDEVAYWDGTTLSEAQIDSLYAISHDRFEVGLEGHWRMEEGTGSTVADLSGNGNDGTITGASWDTGYFGNGLDFDGVDDYIDLGYDFEEWTEGPQKTMSVWVKNGGNTDEARIFNTGYIAANTGFALGIDAGTDNKPFYFLRDTGGSALKTEFGNVMAVGQWSHFAIVQDGANDKAYIYQDGVLEATVSSVGEISQTPPLTTTIGKHFDSGQTNYFEGVIDELQIWSRALSTTEITNLYNFQYHGNPSAIDSAQDGRYVVSRTQSGVAGGGLALFDTHSGTLATPKWTTDVGPGDLVSISDNVAPIVITGSTNGEVELYDLGGTQLMSYTSDLEITGVAIIDNNSYAFASSADHYVYGWDLDPLSAIPAWSTFVDGAVIDMGFNEDTIAVVTKDYLIALNTAGVEQWREKLQSTPAGVEFEAGRILVTYYTTDDADDSFATIENDEDISMYYKPGVPVGLWTFDEGTGTTVEDRSGNGHTGTLNNGAHFTEGLIGGGVELDGVDDDVNFGRFTELDGADKFTLSGWFKFDSSLTHDSRTLWKDDAFGFYMVDPDHCRAYVYYDGGDTNAQGDCGTDAIEYTTDNWIHFTMTYDGSTIRLYRDAIEISTQALADKVVRTKNSDLMIYGSFDQFEGIADEIAIYRTDLSALEITQLYEDTKGRVYEVQDGLVGYWPLDGDADDYSGNGNDGTVTDAIPGEGHVGGAYEFDGSGDYITLDSAIPADETSTVSLWIAEFDNPWDSFLGGTSNNQAYWYVSSTSVAIGHATGYTYLTVPAMDGWHHMAITHDSGTACIYINGVNTECDTTGALSDIKYIGTDQPSNEWFDGNIDEVAIWDRVLGKDEIKQVFYKNQAQFQSGLMAYYPINKDGSGTVKDESSYYNYAEDINEMTLTGGVGAPVEGKIYNGLEFDGVNDYGEIADASENFGGHSAMTWNMWVNPVSAGSNVILDKNQVFRFYLNPTGTFYGYIFLETSGENGGYGNCQATSPFVLDSWQMFTATYDSSDTHLRYYIDGVEFGSCDLSTGTGTAAEGEVFVSNTNSVCIAAQECQTSAANFFDGKVDETAIWTRALSIEEVGELYNSRTHDNQYLNQRGWTLFTSTGERITDGYPELHVGGAIAEDGTIATFRDDDLGGNFNNMYLYESSSNSAAYFDGTGNTYVNTPDIEITTDMTISLWVKPDVTGYGAILGEGTTDTDRLYFQDMGGNTGRLNFYVNNWDIGWTSIIAANSLDWNHVVVVRDISTGNNQFYINGIEAIPVGATSIAPGSTWILGNIGSYDDGNLNYDGGIADVRIYGSMLSMDQINTLGSKNPITSGSYVELGSPLVWYKLNEDYSATTTVADSSIHGQHGTTTGDVYSYYNNMQSRYAVFDGVDDFISLEYNPSINEGVSFSIWFKEEDFTAQTGILSRRYAEDGLAIWNACDQWAFRLELDSANNAIYTTGNCDGGWHNFIGTWDGFTMRTYVDGTFQDAITPGCSPCELTNDGFKFNIGRDQYSPNYFGGSIADARIYDTAISQADITAIAATNPAITGNYAETFATPVGWWKLNGYPNWAFDGDAVDSSSNNNGGDHNGGITYQHPGTVGYLEAIGESEGIGTAWTGDVELRDITFGNGGNTMVFADGKYTFPGEGGRLGYYDSLGNGWQDTDFECYHCESFYIETSGEITAIMEDNRNLVWGTTYGNTEFKSPGLHPTTANVIAFWQLQAGDGRPVYTKVVPQIVNNGTFWAGAMAISLEGDLWVESKYDGEGGQQYFVLYKYDKLGNLETTLSQEEYPFMKKTLFNPDSRSSIDIATNGSVLLSIDNNFIFISEDTPKLLTIEGNDFTGPGQVKFLGDTGLIALSGGKGDANEYAVYNLHTNSVAWQFNADVTAFQIDASDNGDYIIFTNGTQMLFKAPANNTLFTKAISGVKAAAVANNGVVAIASSVNGWFVYDKTGNLLVSGGAGQRVYDVDLDHDGKWMAVSGYDPVKGTAWMEMWALEEDRPFYEQYERAFRTEKSSDSGELRSYRVMIGEGSVQVFWGWAGAGGAGAELYTFEHGITLIEILEANINLAFSTIILIAIIVAMIGFLRKMFKGSGIVG